MASASITGGARSAGTTTAQDRISRHQHATEILRARSVLLMACTLWLVVGVFLDVTTHGTIGHGSLGFVLAVRLAASAFHGVVLALLFRPSLPHLGRLRLMATLTFPVSSLALAVIASRMGGLASPYGVAMLVIITAQAMALPGHWKRAAVLATITVTIYPVTMLIAVGLDDHLRAQLDDRVVVIHFLIVGAILLAGAILAAWGSHVIFSLRQSIFESRSIGRYKLIRRIGRGGMGEVWRAHDRAMRRAVALKILSPEQGKNLAAVARFEREIQATAELSHPNTVRIHDWGVTDDGVWYYAMEVLDGVDLANLVKHGGPLPPALVVHLGVQAARAIAEAHGRGIVHRDLKPGNLFVVSVAGEADFVKVLDFGVARIGDDDDDGLTQAGAVVGTPGYMAPEVVAGVAAGPRADVFGLAASLFFALTGTSPREAGTGTPPSALRPGIPADLDDVLVGALDTDPARRPASAAELATALASVGVAGTWSGRWHLEATPAPDDAGHDATVDAASPPTRAEGPGALGRSITGK